MYKFDNVDSISRAMIYLANHSKVEKHNLGEKKVKMLSSALYINAQVEIGSGTLNLLEGITKSEKGVTNFNGRQLENNKLFVIEEMSIGWAIADKDTPLAMIDYAYEGKLPPYLNHANLVLKQNQEPINGATLISTRGSVGEGLNGNFKKLGGFALLEPNLETDILIESPRDVTMDASYLAANHKVEGNNRLFLSIVYNGFETFIKG